MKWNSKTNWGRTTWIGRKNVRSLNSLCSMPKFKTLEEVQDWCEKLTQSELIRLREEELATRI